MDREKRLRRPLRIQLTKTIHEVEAELTKDEPDFHILRSKLAKLEEVMPKVTAVDEKIMDLMLDTGCTDEEQDQEVEAVVEYSDRVRDTKLKINSLLYPPPRPGSRSVSPPASEFESAAGSEATRKRNFKLPKIELKKFSGELKDWIGFWSQFQKIDEDESLHETDKFQYLLQAMVPCTEPSDLINSFPQSAVNYPKAVQALKQRFGNESLLIQVYVRELLKLAFHNVTQKEKVPVSKMFIQLKSHLRSLESLQLASADPSTWLFPLVESSLQEDLLRAWQRSPISKKDGSKENPKRTHLDYLMEFLESEVESEQRIQLAQNGFQELAVSPKPSTSSNGSEGKKRKQFKSESEIPTAAGLFSGHSNTCVFCEKNHDSEKCLNAQKMSLEERNEKVKSKNACFICLKVGHGVKRCKGYVSCIVCHKKHSTIMCPELTKKSSEQKKKEEVVTTQANLNCTEEVLLQTLIVTLHSGGREKKVRVLCDPGSQHSYILKRTAEELSLKPTAEVKLRHTLFSGRNYVQQHFKYRVDLKRLDHKNQNETGSEIEVLDQNQICEDVPRLTKGPWMEELKKRKIWFSDVGRDTPEIEILVGSDFYPKIFTGNSFQLQNGLLAIETKFGWTLSGRVTTSSLTAAATALSLHLRSEELQISTMWDLESIGITDPSEHKSKQEREAETRQHFLQSVRRLADGRYSVKLPWIDGALNLPNNKKLAEQRLISTTRKLLDRGYYATYDGIFQSWVAEGIIEPAIPGSNGHYLPHHPVIKPGSLTTPVRPVFDASSKAKNEPSLNDCLQKGPNLMELIPSILMRFRENKIGIISDIRKAFLMVGVEEEDRNFLKFLWWEDAEQKVLKEFRHRRVVFGVNSSPFLLAAVLEHHLTHVPIEDQKLALKLLQSLYVDNSVTSVETVEEYREFRETSVRLLQDIKMELRCWEWGTDEADLWPEIHSQYESEESSLTSQKQVTKVLGMTWDKEFDTLGIDLEMPETPSKITKRSILSTVHKVFDPIGFTAPALIKPKLLLQEVWAKEVDWDEELSEEVAARFRTWVTELVFLKELKIPRYLKPHDVPMGGASIHTFCDASQDAYAAVIFLRTSSDNGTSIRFMQAKARVSPLKRTKDKNGVTTERRASIPRLELLAAVIGARLTRSIKEALGWDITTYFWSDSSTAIAWIQRNEDWGTFVGNRVREILSLTEASEWRHVPGKANPADLPSRGCSPSQLLNSCWWEGPEWLSRPKEEWPVTIEAEVDEDQVNLEKRKSTQTMAVSTSVPWFQPQVSLYFKKVKVMAWILRIITNLRKPTDDRLLTPYLTIQELRAAENKILKIVQKEAFPNGAEDIRCMKTTVGEDGLIRIKSKLTFRTDSMEFRSPVVLPKDHPLVTELIEHVHVSNCHAGTQAVLGLLREKYWILRGRQAVGKIIHRCVTCLRYSAKGVTVDTAPLPIHRVETVEAFQNIGVDLAGPLFLRDGTKAWIVLFTCAVYRAVHLDLVTSLSTEAFLGSLERFIYTQGRPNVVYSDNGTNFVGSVNLFKKLNWKKIEDASQGQANKIRWIFNPPTAAWWGGWWERLVRSTKDLLRKMLGRAKLTYDELRTCLAAVEATINSRPLTTVTEDQNDLIPLTPRMFIRPLSTAQFPEGEMINSRELQGRYKKIQELKKDLQARFRKEYLALLVQKAQEKTTPRLKVGDVVLIGSDDKKRFEWPLGRILELIPGRDSVVRTAKVQVMSKHKTKDSQKYSTEVRTRPLQRLFPLEVSSLEEEPMIQPKQIIQKDPATPEEVEPQDKETATRSGRKIIRPRHYGQWNYK